MMECKYCGQALRQVDGCWVCDRHAFTGGVHRQYDDETQKINAQRGKTTTCWCPLCDLEKEANQEYPYGPTSEIMVCPNATVATLWRGIRIDGIVGDRLRIDQYPGGARINGFVQTRGGEHAASLIVNTSEFSIPHDPRIQETSVPKSALRDASPDIAKDLLDVHNQFSRRAATKRQSASMQ
jgi:hypothetical protein